MRYFKGWYFKCSANEKTVAFIPSFHCTNDIKSASLQIITDNETFNIPFDSLKFSENPLYVKLGTNIFSDKGIILNIKNEKLNIAGKLRFTSLSPISYDIMGPFGIVPFMQCRHRVFSMRHIIDGQIMLNETPYDFSNGIGYIEGDCGYSFPKRYIWTQSHFNNGSLMLSVADIPILGFRFTGIIGIIIIDGKEYRIATYLGAHVKQISKNTVTVKQSEYQFTAKLIEKNSQPLFAPENGRMSRTIHESASCSAYYCFSYKGKPICEFTGNNASFEFEYM